jgi:imidazolonepropionase-like amidohydrolase
MRLFLTILTALVCWAQTARPDEAQSVAIKAGRLFDPETGAVVNDQTIVVRGTRIECIGVSEPIPDGAEIVDLSQSTVAPGMFDCHTHVCCGQISRRGLPREASGKLYFAYDVGNTSAYRAIQGVANARSMLETGFTTIRDVGNAGNYADTDLRRAIAEGLVPGPTMITAGRIIAPFGGQYLPHARGYTVTPERPGLLEPEYIAADTHDELRKAIHKNVFFGAQLIKIVVDDQKSLYSVDDIKVVLDEARLAGLKVAAHCVTERGARNAAEAGVDSIEHGFSMSDEALRIAKENKVVLVGTDFTSDYLQEYGQDDDKRKANHEKYVDRIKRAYAIGITMAFGSDVIFDAPPRTRGEVCLSMLDSYAEAKLPNAYILRMLTSNAAQLLGVEQDRGALRPGLAADIIAMPDNPLEDIAALRRVNFVMKDGRIVRRPK